MTRDQIVEARLRDLDRIREDGEQRTRSELLHAAAEGDIVLDVDVLDRTLGDLREEWSQFRAKLRAGLIAASAGDWTVLDSLCAPVRSCADDDRPSRPHWRQL